MAAGQTTVGKRFGGWELGTRGWPPFLAGVLMVGMLLATGQPTTPVEARQGPQRIVSLVPSITEMIYAIGAGSRIVAVSSFDHFPLDVDRLPRVGALLDPDVEKILSLRPDLVITYGSQTELTAKLTAARIPTFTYRHSGLADILTTMRALGTRLGVETPAAKVASKLEQDLAAIRLRVQGHGRPKTMLVIGREPRSLRAISVSGGYGFLHDLLELAGGTNVFGEVKRESLLVSTETILARAPDFILELHYTDEPTPALIDQERGSWSVLAAVPAVRRGKVILLFGEELVLPGPRVLQTATSFARALHPDIMPW